VLAGSTAPPRGEKTPLLEELSEAELRVVRYRISTALTGGGNQVPELIRSGRPGESHPRAPTEPFMRNSA
jgi:hypothetical protein